MSGWYDGDATCSQFGLGQSILSETVLTRTADRVSVGMRKSVLFVELEQSEAVGPNFCSSRISL